MESDLTRLDAIARECVAMYLRQGRSDREWNEAPPELDDIVYAQAATHEVNQAALAERVRADLTRRRGEPAGDAERAT